MLRERSQKGSQKGSQGQQRSTAAPHAWPGGLLGEVVGAADDLLWQMACPFHHHLTATEILT